MLADELFYSALIRGAELYMFKCLAPITCSTRVYLYIASPTPISLRVFYLPRENVISLHLNSAFFSENGGYVEHQLM